MVTLGHFLLLSGLLMAIGLYGVLTRRNLIAVLMSVEILLNAAALAFASVAAYRDPQIFTGQVFALFIIVVAAAELSIGFAILLNVYRTHGAVADDAISEMRG
ncbi:NADH-quinone oxidoreductase subunit NuoK [Oceanithermus sp.]